MRGRGHWTLVIYKFRVSIIPFFNIPIKILAPYSNAYNFVFSRYAQFTSAWLLSSLNAITANTMLCLL